MDACAQYDKVTLRYDLQLFAKEGPGGERTEPATEKKRKDSRAEGQVAKSKELTVSIGLLVAFVLLKFYIGTLGTNFIENFSFFYSQIPDFSTFVEGNIPEATINWLFIRIILRIVLLLLPIFLVCMAVAFCVDLFQVKWAPTKKPLQPKFSKLNPVSGMKRIFSKEKLVELLKSLIKLGVVGYVAVSSLLEYANQFFALYEMSLNAAIGLVGDIAINLGIKISFVYLIIGLADWKYQTWKHEEDLKMTKQEVKDEWKNSEGDPEIKGKQKARMREASRRRMMSAVPKADVVITNPTHFAVALKYDPDVADAPYVVAKGEDFLARRIKEIAAENDVDIVENKPLARMLYYNVELGDMIPPELYQVVADILATIYKQRHRA